MLFLTYWFVLFALIAYPLYWFIPHRGWRLGLIAASSSIFHTYFAGPAGILPVVVLAAVVFAIGRTRNRKACVVGVVLCAASLMYYKYTEFLCASVLGLVFPSFRDSAFTSQHFLSPAAPLAISFFTFEFIHYLVEIRNGQEPIRRVRDFAIFTIYWPSIVAGPVKRYQSFLEGMHQGVLTVSAQDAAQGLLRFTIGIVKKFAADSVAAWILHVGGRFDSLDLGYKWLFTAALAARILLDFSGYTDMAIGLSRMYGIPLPENFNWPYFASSLADFWRRWHCSLSTWIRDYIYIALGGSQCGQVRRVSNGILAFAICGLWHGANWNFLVWGLYHGLGLAVCSSYRTALGPVGDALHLVISKSRVLGWLTTMLFVGVGWILFFFPLETALRMIPQLFGA